MFGSKTPPEAEPFDDEGYSQVYEYQAVAYFGLNAFNSGVGDMANKGWELVNGCMVGTAHYAYLRRKLRAPDD